MCLRGVHLFWFHSCLFTILKINVRLSTAFCLHQQWLKIASFLRYNLSKIKKRNSDTLYKGLKKICSVVYYMIKYIWCFIFTAAPECDAGQFSCESYKFNHTNCIPSHYQCDKEKDCHDGSDEQTCSKYILSWFIIQISIWNFSLEKYYISSYVQYQEKHRVQF